MEAIQDRKEEARQLFQRLELVYFITLAVHLLAFSGVYLDVDQHMQLPDPLDAATKQIVGVIIAAVVIIDFILILFFFPRRIKQVPAEGDVMGRLQKYKEQMTVKFLALGGTSLMAVAGLFLTHNAFFNVLYLALFFYGSYDKPNIRKAGTALRFNKEEFQSVNFPKG